MESEELKEIQELFQEGWKIRAIARKLARDPKTIRHALGRAPRKSLPPKLENLKPLIQELAAQGLKAPRILRDLREKGYTGGLTFRKEYLREIRGTQKKPLKV